MQIIEFIASNYIWFLVLAIMIILAIIGYYVDKTNFGKGSNSEEKINNEENINLDNVGLLDIANNFCEIDKENDLAQTMSDQELDQKNIEENVLSEDTINKFEEEFNSILPQKDLVNSDLLNDIENFNLEKTQKLELSDVPDLDDVELPSIKRHGVEKDIWKF